MAALLTPDGDSIRAPHMALTSTPPAGSTTDRGQRSSLQPDAVSQTAENDTTPVMGSTQATSSTQEQFRNTHIDLFPATIRHKPKMRYEGEFSATIYNTMAEKWSMYHSITSCGSIQNESAKDLTHIAGFTCMNNDYTQVLDTAAHVGLAAVKIYIRLSDATTTIMSGFFLEGEYVVSCCCFDPGNALNETENRALLDTLKTGVLSTYIVVISSEFYSFRPYVNSDRVAYLLDADESSNIAIFRLYPEQSVPKDFIKTSQLYSITSSATLDLPSTIWTVGYNGDDEAIGDTYLLKDEKIKNILSRMTLSQITPSPANTSNFLYRLYLEHSLLKSDQGWKTRYRIHRNGQFTPPPFSHFYRPNTRAIAAGNLVATERDHINTAEVGTGKSPLTKIWRHTISGFCGISGAMIGAFFGGSPAPEPKVIGLFQGGSVDEETNGLLAFTPESIQWIQRQIQKAQGETA